MKTNLSIIIPHYNIPDLLCRLLTSIPEREDIEVIVVDDCSTESLTCVKDYIADRNNVRLFLSKENGGAGKCRNFGLSKAKGRWVLFSDSDDFFLPNFYDAVSTYFDSEADIVFFTATSKEIDTGEEGTRHILLNDTICSWLYGKSIIKNELNIRYKINGPVCKLIRKELIDNHNIKFDQVKVSNDELFSTKVGFYARIIDACNTPIYCITTRSGSLIEVISEENFMIRLQVFIRKYHFLKTHLSKRELRILDLSAQEKLFSMIQNRYGVSFCSVVIKELIRGRIPFITTESFKPSVLASKIKLARTLNESRKKESKYILR